MPEHAGEPDGRRRRGNRRRRALLDATLQVIGRDGLAAVSQRAVAAEAGLPPSALYYYFPALDDLVTAALVDVNDRCLAQLDGLPDGDDTLHALAVVIVDSSRGRTEFLAELELWVRAARHAALRGELERWNAGLRAAAAKLADDPITIDALVAAVNGYYWQAAADTRFGVEQLETILRHIVRRPG